MIFVAIFLIHEPFETVLTDNTNECCMQWKDYKFTWCFHKQNYYMFYHHANVQRT
jgi:hypothetical protein